MVVRVVLLLSLSLSLLSCERTPPRQLPTTTASEPVLELELKPLTPLVSNRPTHVTVDRVGNVYWVQESEEDRRDDTMFVIGEGEIPRATQLSAGNIAAALGAPGGRGNIQGIAASGQGGEVYFYFNGSLGRKTLAGVGLYAPGKGSIRILADGDAIAAATGMGRSLPLARGSLISDGRFVWLWVRHTDAWSIFKIDPVKLPPDGPVSLAGARAMEKVTLEGKALSLTRDEYNLAPAPDGSLFLFDGVVGQLLKLDVSGKATVVRSLAGFPRDLSTPVLDRTGKMLMFAAKPETNASASNTPGDAGAGATSSGGAPPPSPTPAAPQTAPAAVPANLANIAYPAMLMFDGDKVSAIESPKIMAYPGFQVFRMRLRELIPNPTQEGWIAYDYGSGELLRVKIHEKLW